ncbi:glycosyltransferase family 1 protein [Micrococcus sp.]|uniref:glycosyltransferase family 4 protein n=1 Tax=Micrococcus sp. TaxID=1271 RepID=UPI002A911C38|nr:glycosyltransferase family 1 protein [Micrococcus sp.]MDY6055744.1 glycosyltransferase family 1 protein [Micrococcus sp.]
MRVAVIAESFLPHMNGVTHSVLQVLRHLRTRGDEAVVIAPAASWAAGWTQRGGAGQAPREVEGFRVHTLPSVPMSGYASVRVAAGTVSRVRGLLADFRPDVVHIASPFVLGWRAVQAAEELGVPSVAVYQTEVPRYAARYGAPWLEDVLWGHVARLHNTATLTLAPSSFTVRQLHRVGVRRVHLWARGVDSQRFHPAKRDEALRARLAPGGERLVGFVGRLAHEKQVEDLRVLTDLPGTRLVVIGSGPLREQLERQLPDAHFAGFQGGEDLARHVASLDLFVHPGESDTFGQTLQEAMASGVPVVAVGRGGPLDIVDSSRTGWIYPPGDLAQLRARVADLVHDDAKRAAFGRAARQAVQGRTWPVLCEQLVGHYEKAMQVQGRRHGVPNRRG